MERLLASFVVLPLVLAACGGSEGRAAGAGANPSHAPETSKSPQQDSVAATGTAPARCEDRVGDSRGTLDLTNVGISSAFDKVTFTYEYTGRIPQNGSLLFVSSDGQKQYGYKVIGGREASHFIFDVSSAQQKNVAQPATVAANKAVVSFAASDVNLPGLVGGTATVSVDGDDVDVCTLALK